MNIINLNYNKGGYVRFLMDVKLRKLKEIGILSWGVRVARYAGSEKSDFGLGAHWLVLVQRAHHWSGTQDGLTKGSSLKSEVSAA